MYVNDHVVRRGEDADETGDLDFQTGLLLALADGALRDGLTFLEAARGDGPQIVVGALRSPLRRSRSSPRG